MSKNKSLRRIDKEYDKQLRYPDINDYLKDTSYSTVTSNYHDNLIDTQLTYKMQDQDLTLGQITVANTPLKAYFNAFVLYGYHPDLESVSEIRLTIDAFSIEDETTGIFNPNPFNIRLFSSLRNSDRWSLILQALLPNLGINKAINYGIYLSDRTVTSIYNFVFNTAAIRPQVLKKYIHEDMYEDIADDNAKLVQYVKENLYRLNIPMRVEFYYVEDDEFPAFTFLTNFNTRPILTRLRSAFRVRSLAVNRTLAGSDQYVAGNYFTWTAILGNSVELLPKYRIGTTDDYKNASEIFFGVTAGSNRSVVYNRFIANEYHKVSHLLYDIRYPEIYVKYNWKWADTSDVYIFADADVQKPVSFNSFSASPLTIKNYFIGHTPTQDYAANRDTFKIYITFSLPSSVTRNDFGRAVDKFQLKFFNRASDLSGIDPNNYVLLAGSLNEGASEASEVCSFIDTSAGWTMRRHDDGTTKFRVMAVNRNHTKCRMMSVLVTDPTQSFNTQNHFSTELVKYTARVVGNSDGTFTLVLEWPNQRDELVQYFWPFAHFKWIELKMTDFFQVPLFTGQTGITAWDTYTIDKNPFWLFKLPYSDSNRQWYPRGNNLSLKAGVRGFSYTNSDTALANVVQFYPPQFYSLVGKSTSSTINVSYNLRLFCKGFYVKNNNRVKMIDANFITNSAFVVGVRNPKTNKIVYNPFNSRTHFIRNLTAKVVTKFNFDFVNSLVTIEMDKAALLNIIKNPGGVPTGKGVLVLIPAFKFNAAKTFFQFSHNGKYQNEAMFVAINL